jgi:hypothetical protein
MVLVQQAIVQTKHIPSHLRYHQYVTHGTLREKVIYSCLVLPVGGILAIFQFMPGIRRVSLMFSSAELF